MARDLLPLRSHVVPEREQHVHAVGQHRHRPMAFWNDSHAQCGDGCQHKNVVDNSVLDGSPSFECPRLHVYFLDGMGGALLHHSSFEHVSYF